MYAVALVGAVLIGISVAMIVKPDAWARAIVRFSEMRYMHPFEITSRVVFGILFIVGADQTRFPTIIKVVGFALLAVGIGLLFTPPSVHRRFGVWAAEKFAPYFRLAGVFSLAFGAFLIYAAV